MMFRVVHVQNSSMSLGLKRLADIARKMNSLLF